MEDAQRAPAQNSLTDLAHALGAHLGFQLGIRVLSIKGAVADYYGLRAPRTAADADLLVAPGQFEQFCAALEARGWHLRVGREVPSLLPQHSVTFIHRVWSCDIDVHRAYPGFFAEPERAFNALWSTREQLTLGGWTVQIPSRGGAAVIAVLHGLRSGRSSRHAEEVSSVDRLLREGFLAHEREDFYRVAREGGATKVLESIIVATELGDVVNDATLEQLSLWDLNRTFSEDGSAVGWLTEMKRLPWSKRPALVFRALWVPRAEVPRNNSAHLPSWGDTWVYQRNRWVRGARAFKRYVRER